MGNTDIRTQSRKAENHETAGRAVQFLMKTWVPEFLLAILCVASVAFTLWLFLTCTGATSLNFGHWFLIVAFIGCQRYQNLRVCGTGEDD